MPISNSLHFSYLEDRPQSGPPVPQKGLEISGSDDEGEGSPNEGPKEFKGHFSNVKLHILPGDQDSPIKEKASFSHLTFIKSNLYTSSLGGIDYNQLRCGRWLFDSGLGGELPQAELINLLEHNKESFETLLDDPNGRRFTKDRTPAVNQNFQLLQQIQVCFHISSSPKCVL